MKKEICVDYRSQNLEFEVWRSSSDNVVCFSEDGDPEGEGEDLKRGNISSGMLSQSSVGTGQLESPLPPHANLGVNKQGNKINPPLCPKGLGLFFINVDMNHTLSCLLILWVVCSILLLVLLDSLIPGLYFAGIIILIIVWIWFWHYIFILVLFEYIFMSPLFCFSLFFCLSYLSGTVCTCMDTCVYVCAFLFMVHVDIVAQKTKAAPGADELPAFS